MRGHRRPPDHKRKLQSESWRAGTMAICSSVSYRPCLTYLFVPSPRPRPLNSLSPRIYSIFCLANCPHSLLRSYTSPTSMIPLRTTTTQPLASLPASTQRKFRYGSTLLTNSTIPSFPSGLSHTSITSSVAPSCVAIPSFSPAKARSCLIPDALCVITYMVYHPMASISACNTSDRYLWTQPSHRVHYPSCVSIRSSSSPSAAATSHIQMYRSLIALL